MNITDKLTAALKFYTIERDPVLFDNGRLAENKRLAPLHLTLVDLVEAADRIESTDHLSAIVALKQALDRLAEVLK